MDTLYRQTREEIEANERWLSGFKTPAASEALLARVKQAVREELAQQRPGGSAKRPAAWHGVVAAAAAIGLCVATAWYSARKGWYAGPMQGRSWSQLAGRTGVEAAGDSLERSIEDLPSVDEELSRLEAMSSDDAWALSGTTLYDALENAVTDDAAGKANHTGASSRLESVIDESEVV